MVATPETAFDAWKERAARSSIAVVARFVGATLRKVAGAEWAGPCPRCGGTDRFSINTRKNIFNCRGAEGGDVIRMVQHVRAVDFVGACEIITGEPPPDRSSTLTDDEREKLARLEADRSAADAKRAADEGAFRERERKTLYEIWHRAVVEADELVAYWRLRLGPSFDKLPREAWPRLRLVRDMPYYRHGADRGDILARASAQVGPFVDPAGTFRGLHFTWLDLGRPNGKLAVPDPDKPGELLPAKKVRGSKQGHAIVLCSPSSPSLARGLAASAATGGSGRGASQLILGEGIEKTFAVWAALWLAGRDMTGTAAWVAGDLGNLAGKAEHTLRHPTARHASGRPRVVGGPAPDRSAPAIMIPDTVDDLVLLGDSTSDPFETRCALMRATRRWAREGRLVRTAWAPDGVDFDDVMRQCAA